MAYPKSIARIISLSASAILLWTMTTALSGKNSIDSDIAWGLTTYGVERVSGFYGPGSWGAWLLTVVACFLDRAFAEEKRKEDKRSHMLGLDINLVAAYAYPLIAAVDLLIHFGIIKVISVQKAT